MLGALPSPFLSDPGHPSSSLFAVNPARGRHLPRVFAATVAPTIFPGALCHLPRETKSLSLPVFRWRFSRRRCRHSSTALSITDKAALGDLAQ
jgi:hypothetical protein